MDYTKKFVQASSELLATTNFRGRGAETNDWQQDCMDLKK
jgi:hypothetical protein